MFISSTINMFNFNLEGGLETPKKEQKLGKKLLENFISVMDGPEKSTETKQR